MYAIWAGDIFVTYSGFSCIAGGTLVRIERDETGLYFACTDGKHYVESQRDANNECLGLTRAPLAEAPRNISGHETGKFPRS